MAVIFGAGRVFPPHPTHLPPHGLQQKDNRTATSARQRQGARDAGARRGTAVGGAGLFGGHGCFSPVNQSTLRTQPKTLRRPRRTWPRPSARALEVPEPCCLRFAVCLRGIFVAWGFFPFFFLFFGCFFFGEPKSHGTAPRQISATRPLPAFTNTREGPHPVPARPPPQDALAAPGSLWQPDFFGEGLGEKEVFLPEHPSPDPATARRACASPPAPPSAASRPDPSFIGSRAAPGLSSLRKQRDSVIINIIIIFPAQNQQL